MHNDELYGDSGNDTIRGHDGNDILFGGLGEDELDGASGDDNIWGEAGNDVLGGGDGDDILFGGQGDDAIRGGSGTDTAVFEGNANSHTVAAPLPTGEVVVFRGDGEVDTLSSVEFLKFDDELIDLRPNPIVPSPNPVPPVTPSSSAALISGLGGNAGFGENVLSVNDDGSTDSVDVSSIFENGLNFFGREFTGLWVNNNGSVTFNGPRSEFTPTIITDNVNNPEITPFFADIDTTGGGTDISPGGNSTGSNLVYYDFDTINDRFIVTWNDVGYYSGKTDLTNAFQLILSDRGNGDFDIQFRYENIDWTTGDASDGVNGLGGVSARAGFTASTGDPNAYFEMPASGNQEALLALDETKGNTGRVGIWEFAVRSGDVDSSLIPELPNLALLGATTGDPHLITLDGVAYDFHAAGEFVLMRAIDGTDFEVQARMTPVLNSNSLTANSAIAIRLDGRNVMFDASDANPFSINGEQAEIENFSNIVVGNSQIFRSNNVYTVVLAGEDQAVGDGDSQIKVTVHEDRVDFTASMNDEFAGQLEGLLGNADGNADNDVAYEDGTPLLRPFAFEDIYGSYRDDWRVSETSSSLFAYDEGETLEGFYLPDHPANIASIDDFSAELVSAAKVLLLEAGLLEGTVNFNNALLDYLATNDPSYIDSAKKIPVIDEVRETRTFPEEELGRNVAPTDILLLPGNVAENADGGTVVGELSVVDSDEGDTHTLQLVSQAADWFAISGNQLVVAEGARPDFEKSATQELIIEATDSTGLTYGTSILVTVSDVAESFTGSAGNDVIWVDAAANTVTTGEGSDTIQGAVADFYGDTVTDFTQKDSIVFRDAVVPRSQLTVTEGSAIIAIDADGDKTADGSVTLQGTFTTGDFMAIAKGGNTNVTFETFLPDIKEGVSVQSHMVNGIVNQDFLTGDGATDFKVTLRDLGFAGYNNAVGVYEINADGAIVDTRILFENANNNQATTTSITDVEAGHRLGFFVVQDAADWASTLKDTDTLSFVNAAGNAATVSDGKAISLAVNGTETDEIVFHSYSDDLNDDGLEHVLSGVDQGGEAISIGFEDLTGGGDRDYEDVVFRVELIEDGLLI